MAVPVHPHVLPKGLMRIRHFGLLANRHRQARLAQVREALAVAEAESKSEGATTPEAAPGYPCPQCKQGRLIVITELLPCRPNEARGVRRR